MKLKFSQEELAAAGLNGHNDLKLVTHCLDERDEGLDNLFREYLAYKMYNVLTPDSYRVQLVRIQYRDSEGKVSAIKRYGFILEDTDEMAERLGGVECDTCMNPTPGTMIQEKENLLSVFQYMIGNSDWSYRMARNLKFVEKSSGQWLPVPFDFDFSGLVNADYALPNADYGQRDVQNRIFMGLEPDPSILFQTLDLFRTRKGALYAEVKRLKKLTPEARQDIDAYLDQFFFTLENNSKEQLLVTFTPAEWNIPITPGTDDGDSSGGVR